MSNIVTPQHEQVGAGVPDPKLGERKAEQAELGRKLVIDEDLNEFLLNLWSKCEKLNEAEWLTLKRNMMVRPRKYYDGKQYGIVNSKGEWQDYDKMPGEVTFQSNIYKPHVRTALTEISRGVPELTFSHVTPESRYGALIARVAEERYKANRKKLFNALKTEEENLTWLLNGLVFRYTYFKWSDDKKKRIPVMGTKSLEAGEASTVCAVCGAPRKASESIEGNMPDSADECPHCGSPEVKEIAPPPMEAQVVQGYESGRSGENEYAVVDPIGVLVYFFARNIHETAYIIWKQIVLTDVLQTKFDDVLITEGVRSPELRLKQESETGIVNDTWQRGTDTSKSESEYEQGWFDKDLYANYTLGKPMRLRNGVVIPAGTKLGDAFPDGLYIAKNDKKLLDIWNEHRCDKWTSCPYEVRLGSMVGAGTASGLELQDIKNDILNLKMASAFQDAFAKEFVNEQYLDPQTIPNSPHERGVVNNIPEGRNIVGTAIERMPPSGLAPEVYAIDEQISGDLQMNMGTFAGSQSGMPDLKAAQDTATGLLTWRDMTVGRFQPMLAAKADAMDKEQAYQLLINEQKNFTPEQWERIKGDYGQEAVEAYLKCDLRKELEIEVVRESYMPVSSAMRQANMQSYLMTMGEVMQAGVNIDSELGAEIARAFQQPNKIIGFSAHQSYAYQTIDVFKQLVLQVVEQFGDAPTFNIQADQQALAMAQLIIQQAGMEIDVEMDNHQAMMDAYMDWWATDAGRTAPNMLKATVLFRFNEHKSALVQKQQSDLQMQMAAQAPMMEMQQRMAAEQSTQQAEAEAQAREAEMAEKEAERAAQVEDRDLQRESEAEGRVIDTLKTTAELADREREREHQIEMAKAQSASK